jgi:hypothetical protein
MSDAFSSHSQTLEAPASRAFAITPADNIDLASATRAIYVGTAGNLNVVLVGDTAPVTFANVPAGATLPLRVRRVRAAGTTAQNLVGVL